MDFAGLCLKKMVQSANNFVTLYFPKFPKERPAHTSEKLTAVYCSSPYQSLPFAKQMSRRENGIVSLFERGCAKPGP